MEPKFISVLTSSRLETVERYTYPHNKIIPNEALKPHPKYTRVVVSSPDAHLAQYQADRYSSGLMGARVHDTEQEAIEHLRERSGD